MMLNGTDRHVATPYFDLICSMLDISSTSPDATFLPVQSMGQAKQIAAQIISCDLLLGSRASCRELSLIRDVATPLWETLVTHQAVPQPVSSLLALAISSALIDLFVLATITHSSPVPTVPDQVDLQMPVRTPEDESWIPIAQSSSLLHLNSSAHPLRPDNLQNS